MMAETSNSALPSNTLVESHTASSSAFSRVESKTTDSVQDRVDLAKINYFTDNDVVQCNRTATFKINAPAEVYRNDLTITILGRTLFLSFF